MALAQDSGSSGNSYDLGSYPSDFVDEDGNLASSIVVGEDAKAADVVSAIDIAAQLGNDAFAEEEQTVEGAETTEVNGLNPETDVRAAVEGTVTATAFDELVRNYEYDGDNELRVTEEVQVGSTETSNAVNTQVDSEGDVRTYVEQGAVEYVASYRPGLQEGDMLYLLGTEYELTSVESGEIELGATQTNRNLATGDTIEQGPFTVEVTDNDGEDTVYLTVMKDGETLSQDTFTAGDFQSYGENDEFNVSAESVFFGNEERVTLETTYSDTTMTDGEESPLDENWMVDLSVSGGNTVDSVELYNKQMATGSADTDEGDLSDNQVYTLDEGSSLEGPNGFFTVENLGLTDSATEEVSFGEDFEVSFTDGNGFEQTVDVSGDGDLHDGQGLSGTSEGHLIVGSEEGNVPVSINAQTVDVSNDEVTVEFSYGAYEETAEFDLTTSADATITDGTGGDTWNVYQASDTGYGFTPEIAVAQTGSGGASADTVDVGYADSSTNHYFTRSELSSQTNAAPTTLETDFGGVINAHASSPSQGGVGLYSTVDDSNNIADNSNRVLSVAETSGQTGDPDRTAIAAQYDYDSSGDDSDVDSGEIFQVSFLNVGSSLEESVPSTLGDEADGEATVTEYGSMANLESSTSVTVTQPEEKRQSEHAVGEVTTSSSDGQTYTERTPTDPTDVAALDTDDDIESRQASGDNMVLVGGPSVNDLVEDLAGDDLTWSADEYNDGEGLLQSISTDAYDALLVSGESAEDTRAAGEYLVNYEENSEQLEGSSQLRISTENGQVVESGDDSSESEDSQ